jgi:hypothetical protein
MIGWFESQAFRHPILNRASLFALHQPVGKIRINT